MIGMHAHTGKPLGGIDHLRQSVLDILTTPLGSRVMRREYGSRLFELVDAPLNVQTMQALYAATAEALVRWEPRIRIDRVYAAVDGASVAISIEGVYLPSGEAITIDSIPLRAA